MAFERDDLAAETVFAFPVGDDGVFSVEQTVLLRLILADRATAIRAALGHGAGGQGDRGEDDRASARDPVG